MTPERLPADTRIEELSLPVRAFNVLRRGGFDTVGEVRAATESEIAGLWACGNNTLRTIEEAVGGFAPEPESPEPVNRHKPKRSLDSRRALWLAEFHAGATYDEIGEKRGLSRERVRQVLSPLSEEDRKRNRDAREARRVALADQYADEIRQLLSEGMTVPAVARLVGVRVADVQRYYAEIDALGMVERQSHYFFAPEKFSDERILEILREAAALRGTDNLGSLAYDRLRREGGYDWPSAVRITQRLGWSDACRAAGLGVSERPKGMGLRTFTDEQMHEALLRIARELGSPPTMGEYARLYQRGVEPGPQTVRQRFDGWMGARRWTAAALASSS